MTEITIQNIAEYFLSVATLETLYQVIIVCAAIILAYGLNSLIKFKLLKKRVFQRRFIIRFFDVAAPVLRPCLTFLFVVLGHAFYAAQFDIEGGQEASTEWLNVTYEVIILWIVLRLLKLSTDSKLILHSIFLVGVGMIALNHLGYWVPFVNYLENFEFKFGAHSFSIVSILQVLLGVFILFWVAGLGAKMIRSIVSQFKNVEFTSRELIIKASQVFLYFILFMTALNIAGIDLTALAVFGGALGIGLGFGLQKITSNMISGFILLFEKTLTVGDMLELEDGTFGHVREMSVRYTMIETTDSREIMIPNEEFITKQVINWTHSNKTGRLEFKIGVSYGTDLEKAHDLILEAVKAHPRVLPEPEARVWLHEFDDSAIIFRVMYWIDDISKKRWETKSDLMFSIWKIFRDNDILIPFPQQDLHLKSIDENILKYLSQKKPPAKKKK